MKVFHSISIALVMISSPVFAGSSASSGSNSGSYSSSGINFESSKPIGTAFAPGLAASGLSCSGSASIGGAGAGWGLSLGITKEDKACNAREDAKYIHGVTGDQLAAKERLCAMSENRAAFLRAGHPCAEDYSRRTSNVSYSPRIQTIKSFKSMKACRRYAANHPGVTCRTR